MGRKPALILELDSHTADAGLETRIEAFLDVVAAYRQQRTVDSGQWIVDRNQRSGPQATSHKPLTTTHPFTPARTTLRNGRPAVVTSAGEVLPMTDSRVEVAIPSMGRYGSEAFAAVFRAEGIDARALPPADEAALKLGRANTTCKECLPLQLTTGGLLQHIRNETRPDRVTVYFMATASGPCRFGQYRVFMEELIKKQEIPDVAIFSLSGEDAYGGMRDDFTTRGWWAVIVSDTVEDIRSMLLAAAEDPDGAVELLERVWHDILFDLEYGSFSDLEAALAKAADRLAEIPLKLPPEEVPVIGLTGEIFVRRDALSRRRLTEELAEKGFAVTCAPVAEWLHYCDYLYQHRLCPSKITLPELPGFLLKKIFMARYERRIKSLLAGSGLVHAAPLDVEAILDNARPYIQPHLTCETILTVGSALTEIASHVCGVIAIGPFGCMPNRLAEALLTKTMVKEAKLRTDPGNDLLRATLSGFDDLPFLAIETDGSPFPQLINAKLETFCLRAGRLHQEMRMAKFN
jgi:predicted nucleotide-binding protein (sugar kinase/HSP70/actin superfamily)